MRLVRRPPAAPRWAVQAFSEGLWAENQRTGVRIVACCPAAIDTAYLEVLGNHEEAASARPATPPSAFLTTLDALDRGRRHTVVVSTSWVREA